MMEDMMKEQTDDNRRQDTDNEDQKMIAMKVVGVGTLVDDANTTVILMTPVDEAAYLTPAGVSVIFPIIASKALSTLYLIRFINLRGNTPTVDPLVGRYADINGIRFKGIYIHSVKGQLIARCHYSVEERHEVIEADLTNSIYIVAQYDIPLFLEAGVLEKTVEMLTVDFTTGVDSFRQHSSKRPPFEVIHEYIIAHTSPDDALEHELERASKDLSEEQLAALEVLAVRYESYEWAQWLKEQRHLLADRMEEEETPSTEGEEAEQDE